MGILSYAVLTIFFTLNRLKDYTPGQLIFGLDMIILIKYNADCGLVRQINKAQINKYNNFKNKI